MNTIPTVIQFVDAYTDLQAPVVMQLSTPPLFYAPDAVSPRMFYASMDEARQVLGAKLRCPYTGEALRPVYDGGSVMFLGGFDPRLPRLRQEFLHYAAMRHGASDVPTGETRVEPVEEPAPVPRSHEVAVTQEAVDVMKSATEPVRYKMRRKHR